MVLPIVTDPHPTLRKKALAIERVDTEIKKLTRTMIETMYAAQGVGLAAPQIDRGIRLMVVWYPENEKVAAMVNPVIVKKSFRKYTDQEGCLSIPGVYGNVKRHRAVTIEYLDIDGGKQVVKAEMLYARIIQHEIDHLDGILFIDKVIGKLIKKEIL